MAPRPALSRELMAQGTALFRSALDSVTDEQLAGPTSLPGWTGTHVVAHVAANAEALGNLVTWARTGHETPMYSSPDQRNADIEAGATRPAAELREWVNSSAADLEAGLAGLSEQQWQREVRTAQGRLVPATEIPWMRAREVMVHAVDLGGSVGYADLPAEFHAELIDDIVAKRSASADGPALHLAPTDDERRWDVSGAGEPTTVRGPLGDLAAYLTGRPATGLVADGAEGHLPDLPRWL
ncbi:maleylpyruvate isomerase family mycothiol-dependent enzyme [Intrasporangium sp. DVR]|uniref:maleylpyruvate isomerase family mycothiol-dependent enzyme n=1 Tax=Intrasporangium sp. DVR TaxID=3127867 RepID=UPI00313A5B10